MATCTVRSTTGALLTAVVALAPGSVASGDYEPPLIHVSTPRGVVLAAERGGRTLYVRPRGDGSGCIGRCLLDWPPFLVHPDDFPSDGLEVLHRPGGDRQWSLRGRPLHFFVGDTARGEAYGDGIGRWRALRAGDLDGALRREHGTPAQGGASP